MNLKRLAFATTAAIGLTFGAASTSSAHYIHIETPSGQTQHGWAGSEDIPGQGQGLIPGGPTGEATLSPSHDGGLVTACEAIRANGNGVIDIHGPAAPGVETTCRHGGR